METVRELIFLLAALALTLVAATADAITGATGQVVQVTGETAEDNFEMAEKLKKECEELEKKEEGLTSQGMHEQASEVGEEKDNCEEKKNAAQAKGMENAQALPLQALTQLATGNPKKKKKKKKLLAKFEQNTFEQIAAPTGAEALEEGTGLSLETARNIRRGVIQALEDGISVDKETGEIHTPTGSFAPGELQTAKGMQAAGFSDDEIRNISQRQAEIAKDIFSKDNTLAVEGGGGGGYKPPKSHTDLELADYGRYRTASLSKEIASGKRGYSRLSRNLAGGGRMGVVSDDIFKMMGDRYKKLIRANRFLTNH